MKAPSTGDDRPTWEEALKSAEQSAWEYAAFWTHRTEVSSLSGKRYGRPTFTTFAMNNIDHFKPCNDGNTTT